MLISKVIFNVPSRHLMRNLTMWSRFTEDAVPALIIFLLLLYGEKHSILTGIGLETETLVLAWGLGPSPSAFHHSHGEKRVMKGFTLVM